MKENIRRNVFNLYFVYIFEKIKIKSEKYIQIIWTKGKLWIWQNKVDIRNTEEMW